MSEVYNIFFFNIWVMVEKIKTYVNRQLLISKLKKSLILVKYIENFFLIVKTKSNLSTFVFIFSTIFQISKTKFYVFWREKCSDILIHFTLTHWRIWMICPRPRLTQLLTIPYVILIIIHVGRIKYLSNSFYSTRI